MTVSIHQPNYLPYSGYFNKIKDSDIFIVYDTAQYVKNRWDNRNRIKGNHKDLFLTIPLESKKSYLTPFKEILLPDNSLWKKKHYKSLKTYYNKSPYWDCYEEFFFEWYLNNNDKYLVDFSMRFIEFVMKQLDLNAKICFASELDVDNELSSTESLIQLIKAVDGSKYISGPSGSKYLQLNRFKEEKITLDFQNYKAPIYEQLGEEFIPGLSIVDVLLNNGKESKKFI